MIEPEIVYYTSFLTETRLTIQLQKKGLPVDTSRRGCKLIRELQKISGIVRVVWLNRNKITVQIDNDRTTLTNTMHRELQYLIKDILATINPFLLPENAAREFEEVASLKLST